MPSEFDPPEAQTLSQRPHPVHLLGSKTTPGLERAERSEAFSGGKISRSFPNLLAMAILFMAYAACVHVQLLFFAYVLLLQEGHSAGYDSFSSKPESTARLRYSLASSGNMGDPQTEQTQTGGSGSNLRSSAISPAISMPAGQICEHCLHCRHDASPGMSFTDTPRRTC